MNEDKFPLMYPRYPKVDVDNLCTLLVSIMNNKVTDEDVKVYMNEK